MLRKLNGICKPDKHVRFLNGQIFFYHLKTEPEIEYSQILITGSRYPDENMSVYQIIITQPIAKSEVYFFIIMQPISINAYIRYPDRNHTFVRLLAKPFCHEKKNVQYTTESQTVRDSNGHLSDTFWVRLSDTM
jgi:hypothetical protein